ncbi:hypothetical protein Patl1_02262 [Pistacia atlantica]|uniref:Uncharacterized protein n=1 Tax=Pistacia atlantica TaxID=434234 RepID=A0ACC1C4A4_9ROSI|nr:hypothetical protein Patl1_02262 [Pistacia atlantica]
MSKSFKEASEELQRRKDEVNRHILDLKRQRDETRSDYHRYASVLKNARELARKKDVKALNELSIREVQIFMSKWNQSKDFRCNYEKSVMQSLEKRQFQDGRIRILDEEAKPTHIKPLV